GMLQTKEEPSGNVSTITTKPIMRPAENVPKSATADFLTRIESGIVDDPQTKINILSKRMNIPANKFGFVDGKIVYQGEDGYFYPAIPGGAKTFAATTLAHSPEVAFSTMLAPLGPAAATGGAVGGEALRQLIGKTVYNEQQTPLHNLTNLLVSGATGGLGAKLGGKTISGIDLTKGRQGARILEAAGRSRDKISIDEIKRIEALGKQHGIDLLPPQTTRSPELISRFNMLADLPETANMIGGVKRNQAEQVQNAIIGFIDSISPQTSTKLSAGKKSVEAAQDAIMSVKDIRSKKASPIYKKAFEEAPEVDIEPVIKYIDKELKTAKGPIRDELLKAKRILEKPDLPKKEIAPDLVSPKGEKLFEDKITYDTSLKGLHASKMAFDDIISSGKQTGLGNTIRRNYANIRKILLDQMDSASPDYTRARKIFAGDSEVYNQLANKKGIVGKLAKLEGDEVEKASNLIFKSSPQIVGKAKNTIIKYGGEDSWNAILKTHLQGSFEGIKESITGNVTNYGGRFRQKVFGDIATRKMLKEAMSPQQYEYLENFAEVLDRVGLILGKESTTAIRQLELKEMSNLGGSAEQFAKAMAYPLHTWKMSVYNRTRALFGDKYAENLANAMVSQKGADQLKNMLQLKPGSQKLIKEFSTFLTTATGIPLREEYKQSMYNDMVPQPYTKEEALELLKAK
ncbi:MAG: hypothetical protein KKH44_00780, partial [Bacteroidetes bacterium]|nr:hypothetical protein [Bacteroidota bacterium]